jgi:hypothetical protein
MGILSFSLVYLQTVLFEVVVYNFFYGAIVYDHFNGSEISIKILRLYVYPILYF